MIYIYIIIILIYRRKRSCALKHTHYVGKSQKESLQECNCKQPCTNLALYTQSLTDSCCIRLLKACKSDVVYIYIYIYIIMCRDAPSGMGNGVFSPAGRPPTRQVGPSEVHMFLCSPYGDQ